MQKQRLDQAVIQSKLTLTRSQAENYIKLAKVKVNGRVITKPGYFVSDLDDIKLVQAEQYVSRAGLKLASVATTLKLDFKDKIVLDVGSSTGGFTDYALKHGAIKVIAVDVGTDQMHPSLRTNPKISLYEKTNILEVRCLTLDSSKNSKVQNQESNTYINDIPDVIVIDVSFTSLRAILPHIAKHLADKHTVIVAMLKPQFEAGANQANKGVIKNNQVRRKIIKDFEDWLKSYFVVLSKSDSQVAGAKGNLERFYMLRRLTK